MLYFAILGLAAAGDILYTATFYNYNNSLLGSVQFNQGKISLELLNSNLVPLECYETTGYAWHLHDSWNSDETWAWGQDCGVDTAGDHWDPTVACSRSSANPLCNCLNRTDDYNCQFNDDPYTCEVGDFSSKYDAYVGYSEDASLMGTGAFQYEDAWLPHDLDGRSIVFHCTNYSTIFCGQLIRTEDEQTTDPVVKPVGMIPALTASFGFGSITLTDHEIDVSAFDEELLSELDDSLPGGADCYANGLKWHIHTEWEHAESAAAGVCGSTETGGHYDPTVACGSASGNSDCGMCGIDSADYECDFEGEYFSCEIGDFSSKFGFIEIGQEATYDAWDLPPLMKLMGQSIVLHCGDSGDRAICAELMEGSEGASTVEYTTPLGVQTIEDPSGLTACTTDCPVRPSAAATTQAMFSLVVLMLALLWA